MCDKKEWEMNWKKIGILCILSFIFAIGISVFVTGHLWEVANIRFNLETLRIWKVFNRAYILFLVLVFGGLHFIIPIKKMYNWMFDKRWLLGIALLIFLTANRYHGDSIGYYSDVIQPGSEGESAHSILGSTRPIRSDEFVVTTPSVLASSYGDAPYTKYNNVMRGTETLNSINGVAIEYATIGYAPAELAYAILPVEYAFSFCWWFPMIFSFLMTTELFFIISNRKKLLSIVGATLVVFSSFYLWWGFSSFYLSGPGTVVCVYYFLQNREYWKRILFGIGTAICFSIFVTASYPAWQIPLGYMFLAIGVWVLHDNWNGIKKLRKTDWMIVVCSLLFMISLVFSYFYSSSEYTQAIMETAYPGKRIDTGSFYLHKLFYCAQAPFYAYKDIGNPSEAGVFFSVFPIPTIIAAYCWLKEKKKDWLTGGLLLAQIPMLIYVTIGFPEQLAKVLLYSSSTVFRTVDIIGLIQVYFIVIILSRYENVKKLPLLVAIPSGAAVALANIYVSNRDFPDYMNSYQKVMMLLVIMGLCIGLMIKLKDKMKLLLLCSLVAISLFTSVYVRPLMKGLDAIFDKPVANEIQQICAENPDAKWLTYGGGIVLPAYSVACGASTVNSVNTYPNLELWAKLDEESKYEEIYNRYAHVNIQFTDDETSFELIQGDYMQLNLSYEDIKKTDAEYLLVLGTIDINEENSYVTFDKIYEENGALIYQMTYK